MRDEAWFAICTPKADSYEFGFFPPLPFAGDLDVRLDIAGRLRRGLYGVCLGGNQFRDSDQVVGDEVQQKSSGDMSNAAVLGLAHCAMLFAPAEDTFDQLTALLRLLITPMPRDARDGELARSPAISTSFQSFDGVSFERDFENLQKPWPIDRVTPSLSLDTVTSCKKELSRYWIFQFFLFGGLPKFQIRGFQPFSTKFWKPFDKGLEKAKMRISSASLLRGVPPRRTSTSAKFRRPLHCGTCSKF